MKRRNKAISFILALALSLGLLMWSGIPTRAEGKTLVSIEITNPPAKTVYMKGSSFDPGGMVVVATYSDASTNIMFNAAGCTFTPENDLQPSDKYVTISYTEGGVTKTATQAITVTSDALVLTGIAVTRSPVATGYTAGRPFDPAGMVITAAYSDGSTRAVTGYTYEPSGALQVTDSCVTISYTEGGVTKTTTQAITVREAFVPSVNGIASLGRITIWWNLETNMTKSHLQRRVLENGAWSGWTTISSDQAGTSFEDLDVKDGAEYQYRVRGYDGIYGTWSAWGTSPVIPYVSVESVTLSKTSLSLAVRQTAVLKATVHPDNASEKRVEWRSDNTLVADVDANGVIHAYSLGTANITATALDGSGKAATCTVTVNAKARSVTGSVSGANLTYSVENAPSGAKLLAAWYDSDGKLLGSASASPAAGDSTGKLTVGAGAAKYRLMLVDGSTFAPLCPAWGG